MLCPFYAAAEAQQPKTFFRIGYLSSSNRATESTRADAIRLALRDLNYIDSQNITIEYRYADGNIDRFPELAAELVRLKVDIIVTAGGNLLVRSAMNATKTIPIVMIGGGLDPVAHAFVESLAKPGGNVTGLTNLGPDLSGKCLGLLKEAVPKVARIAVLYNRASEQAMYELKEILPVSAGRLGLTVRSLEVRDTDGFEKAFAQLKKERLDGLYVPTIATMLDNRKRIADFALRRRIPSVYSNRRFVDVGGLMSYGADLADSYRRVAYYVDKILKGAKPGALPIEQPTKFELVINVKTAKQIGLTIPPNVLARADRVIK